MVVGIAEIFVSNKNANQILNKIFFLAPVKILCKNVCNSNLKDDELGLGKKYYIYGNLDFNNVAKNGIFA